MDSTTLVSLMKMGAKVQKLLEIKNKNKNKDKVKASFSGRSTEPAAIGYNITDKG